MSEPVRRRPWLDAVQVVLVIALVAWLIHVFGAGAVTAAGAVIRPHTVVAAVLLGLVGGLAQGLRWRAVAAGLGDHMTRGHAVARCLEAAFLNAVLPGGVAGDAVRAFRRGRSETTWSASISSVVGERLCGTAIVMLAATGAAVSLDRVDLALGVGAVTVIVSGVAGWSMRRLPPVAVAACLGWSVVGWLAYLGLFALAATGLADAGATPHLALDRVAVLGSLVIAGMSVPLNVGGWGPREAAAVLAYGIAGLPAADGLTTSVAYGLLALVSVAPGAVVLIAARVRYTRPRPTSDAGTDLARRRPAHPHH